MENEILVKASSTNIQNAMRYSGVLCDGRLLLDDGGIFEIHRIILCAACAFFRALFTYPFVTENRRDVHVRFVRTEIMECVIDFAYASSCRINDANVIELLATAEYFGFLELINQCADHIENSLTPTNCISLMAKTRRYVYAHEIQNKLRNYVLHNFHQFTGVNKEEILNLSIDDLFDVIADDKLNVQSEESVWEHCVRWIQFDEKNRVQYTQKLLQGIRLALMDPNYFLTQVRDHVYVRMCPETKPIIMETIHFMFYLDDERWYRYDYAAPILAIPRLPYDVLFAIGGWNNGIQISTMETYDNRARLWTSAIESVDRNEHRIYHDATVINHKIFCIGGLGPDEPRNSCKVFDALTKTWSEIAPMHDRRCYPCVCVLNGKIYAMGGKSMHSRLYSCEIYNPESNQWILIASMNRRRSDAAACTFNGRIYITGGFDGHHCTPTCEVYDVEKDEWSMIANMLHPRSGHKCIAYKNSIFVCGGYDGLQRLDLCEKYDPNTNTWSRIRSMNVPRTNFGAAIIDGTIFVAGGYNNGYATRTTELYKDNENKWYFAAEMSQERFAFSLSKVSGLPNVEDFVLKRQ